MNPGLPERRLRPAAELGANRPHGVRLRYMAGCRCFKCRRANSSYEAQRIKARAAGDWNGYVDTTPARLHILKLSGEGLGYPMVAAATSVSRSTVLAIRNGRQLQARARTVRKICAVTIACLGDGARVPAAGTWQKIGWLLEEGYTKAALARLLGHKSPALQIRKDLITVRTRARVERLYRRLTA